MQIGFGTTSYSNFFLHFLFADVLVRVLLRNRTDKKIVYISRRLIRLVYMIGIWQSYNRHPHPGESENPRASPVHKATRLSSTIQQGRPGRELESLKCSVCIGSLKKLNSNNSK